MAFTEKIALKRPGIARKIIKYIVLIFAGVTMLYPIVWVLICSFKDNQEIYAHPFSLPSVWRIDNYTSTWSTSSIGRGFLNSIFVTVATIVIVLLICSLASFVISRIEFKLNFAVYAYILMGMMIPAVSCLLPLFVIYQKIGLINKLPSLILIYSSFNISVTVFILVGFMKTIPKALEETAIIDGCSINRVFWQIILPLSKAAIVTVAILLFMGAWNEYLYAFIFISKPAIKTLPVMLAGFKTAHQAMYGPMSAGIVISALPVIIFYVLMQEQVIKGITAGAIKG